MTLAAIALKATNVVDTHLLAHTGDLALIRVHAAVWLILSWPEAQATVAAVALWPTRLTLLLTRGLSTGVLTTVSICGQSEALSAAAGHMTINLLHTLVFTAPIVWTTASPWAQRSSLGPAHPT
jgi:hypothetical protein